MKMFLLVLIVTVLIVLLSFWGIGIKMIIKKNGEFKRHCSSVDPLTGDKHGCVCGKTIMDDCETKRYSPLEVNRELLEECGNLPNIPKRKQKEQDDDWE
ncbi:MAG: hypothetical protein J6V54_09615 [Bacteroidales bacterium]|nr:hypothetical protein [Bacteroidales bacterium]